jgi:5'-nucleotidase
MKLSVGICTIAFAIVANVRADTIGTVATDLCHDRYPGQGWYEQRQYPEDGAPRASTCTATSTPQGSDVFPHLCKAYLLKTGADICIDNGGYVRSDIPSGDLTDEVLDAMFRWSNEVVVIELSGADIVAALEEAVESGIPGYYDWLNEEVSEGSGSYPYATGLQFDADVSTSPGSGRVSNVLVKSGETAWVEIDPSAVYKVATSDFTAGVGSYAGEGYYPAFAVGADTAIASFGVGPDVFKEYVTSVGVLEKLPLDDYSTQSFIADPAAGDDNSVGDEGAGDDSTSPAHLTTLSTLVVGMIAMSVVIYCM